MRQDEIDELQKPAFSSPLAPGKVRELGEDSQVWGLEIGLEKRTSSNALINVSLYGGETGLGAHSIPFTAFPAGQRGITLETFTRAVYDHLKAKGEAITKKTRLVLYTFDALERYSVLDIHDLDERITFNPSGGANFSLHYLDKKAGHSLEIVDLHSYFPNSDREKILKNFDLADMFQPPKKPTRKLHDDAAFTAWTENTARLNYLMLTVMRSLTTEEFGVDAAVYRTPASLAARVFVSKYLTQPYGKARHYIRMQGMRSFWGGRMEAFARGHFEGDINMYDAVSLYPSAAIGLGEMPLEFDWFRLTHGLLDLARGGICTVEFQFPPDELHPCLPVYAAGMLYFPLSGTSHCTVHEVRYAVEIGASVRLIEGYGYFHGSPALAEYSRDLLARKEKASADGDMTRRELYKLLLNSLYGKFGQHRREYDLNDLRAICRKAHWPNLQTLWDIPNWQDVVGDQMSGGEGQRYEEKIIMGGQWCPEWAALIQGYARMIESRAMREYVALAGTTDSVIVQGDAGDSFDVQGVTFRRERRGSEVTIIRQRMWAMRLSDGSIECALGSAPNIDTAPAEILNWQGDDFLAMSVKRPRTFKTALEEGVAAGIYRIGTQTANCTWDGKRILEGNYSLPHAAISGK